MSRRGNRDERPDAANLTCSTERWPMTCDSSVAPVPVKVTNPENKSREATGVPTSSRGTIHVRDQRRQRS